MELVTWASINICDERLSECSHRYLPYSMFLEAKNWSTRLILHEEDNGEVLGPLRGDQDQVGDVGKFPEFLGVSPFKDRAKFDRH